MSLSEKIAIGVLEEDNPVKSYYRFKPIVTETENGFEPVEDVEKLYPEDGFLRIVPDKNESSHFKARMRRTGRFCMIDLRRHQSESDKIRSNKNYRSDGLERNVNIVYSDVIVDIPSGKAAEIIHCEEPEKVCERGTNPGSTPFLLECGGKYTGPFQWEALEGEENAFVPARSTKFAPVDGDALPEGSVQLMMLDEDHGYMLLLAQGDKCLFAPLTETAEVTETAAAPEEGKNEAAKAKEEPAAESEAAEEKPAAEPEEMKTEAEKPAAEEPKPVSEAAKPVTEAPKPAREAEKPAAEAPKPVNEAPKPAQEQARPARAAQPKPANKPAPQAAKPAEERKNRNEKNEAPRREAEPRSQMNGVRASQRSAAIEAQRGLNPKRGVSLAEIVDDQWRASRLEQLGHPVPPEAGTKPLMSPVDKVRAALKDAWQLDEARGGVLDAVLALDQLTDLLPERLGVVKQPLTTEQMNELDEFEARRLKALQELDRLQRAHSDQRHALMEEVRSENAIELRKLENRKNQAEADARKSREAANEAAEAERIARKALNAIDGEELLTALVTDELKKRAAAVLRRLDDVDRPAQTVPELVEPTAGELVSELRVAFEDYGMTLTNDQAVNLLAGFTLFDVNVYSGVTGSGKSRAVRLLAQTLGLADSRFVTLHADTKSAAQDKKFEALNGIADAFTPLITMIDDANALPGDPTRGLNSLKEAEELHPNMRLMLTVQDNPVGYAMNANLLDRAFFVRFDLPGLELPWKPVAITPHKAAGAVTAETLKKLFAPKAEISHEVQDRMLLLRRKLADVGVYFSARALSDMYNYIAAVQPMMTCSPMQVLDYALAQRGIPCVLATAPVDALHELPKILADMPMSLKLLDQPLAVPEL